MEPYFSTSQAATLSALDARRLREWARRGLVTPAGGRRGGRWCWSFGDLVGLRVLSVLVHEHGLSGRALGRLLPRLSALTGGADSLASLAAAQLAVTGNRVLLVETDAAYTSLVELFETPGQQVLGIFPLEQVFWDVQLSMKQAAQRDRDIAEAVTQLHANGDWRVA